jgi:hypothetical protein
MKFIGNIYLWLTLGSILAVTGGDALYRDYNPDSKEAQQAAGERRDEGESSTLFDPYLDGFFIARVLGGGWCATPEQAFDSDRLPHTGQQRNRRRAIALRLSLLL